MCRLHVPASKPSVPRESCPQLSAFLCDRGEFASSPFPKSKPVSRSRLFCSPRSLPSSIQMKPPNQCKWERKRGRRLGPIQPARGSVVAGIPWHGFNVWICRRLVHSAGGSQPYGNREQIRAVAFPAAPAGSTQDTANMSLHGQGGTHYVLKK